MIIPTQQQKGQAHPFVHFEEREMCVYHSV